MPTQANVPALKWHYTVLWHRSTVHPAAWAGLQAAGLSDRSSEQPWVESSGLYSRWFAGHLLSWTLNCFCRLNWLSTVRIVPPHLGHFSPRLIAGLCKETGLYCIALSLCPAAGDWWDSFCPRLPFIGAPLRLQTVTAVRDCFIGLLFALSIAHWGQITGQTLLD